MKTCDCISELNKQLAEKPEKAELEIAFNLAGQTYPYMSATYQKKSGRGFRTMHVVVVPTYCPFCGKKYRS
jgi:hypothetical protein